MSKPTHMRRSPKEIIAKKPGFIIGLTVFVVAAVGLLITLMLRSCTGGSAEPTQATKFTGNILPTTAIKGSPIKSADDVLGTWTLDGNTNYSFSEGATGAMSTSSVNYEFSYSVSESVLYIDFADDNVRDCAYMTYLDDKTSTLTFDDTESQQIYELKKK